jgi:phenylalanine-4-hydroxylase
MKQVMKNYKEEDVKVWNTLFTRQIKNLEEKACPEYLFCLEELAPVLHANAIPNLSELSDLLFEKSGWKIEIVPGLIPVKDFFELLAKKKFCSSTWLRKMSQLDYLEEPDMFHDIFGHIPLLLHPTFGEFAQKLGEIGLEHSKNETVVIQLQRLYWFSIEFGIIQSAVGRKIYGAGIISSFQETYEVFEVKTEILPFNLQDIIHSDFNNMTIQTKYYELESFEELFESLNHFKYETKIVIKKKQNL